MSSLGSELPRQVARVARSAALFAHAIGVNSATVLEMLAAIDDATEAQATADVVGMLRAHQRLKLLGTAAPE